MSISASNGWASSLPVELVTEIATYLSERDVRRLSWTSRRLRAIITAQAMIFLPVKVVCGENPDLVLQGSLARTIADYAVEQNLYISFTMDCDLLASEMGTRDGYWVDSMPIQPEVFNLLGSILSRTVRLCVTTPGHLDSWLRFALDQPVPHLRSFTFKRVPTCGRKACTDSYENMFKGCAPRLRHVTLQNVVPSPIGASAWTNVRSLTLDYTFEEPPPAQLAELFPSLRHLRIRLKYLYGAWTKSIPLDFRGLKLERLDIMSSHFGLLHTLIDMAAIHTIAYATHQMDGAMPGFWDVFKDGCDSYVPLRMTARVAIKDRDRTTIICMRPDSKSLSLRRAAIYSGIETNCIVPGALFARIVSMHFSNHTIADILACDICLYIDALPALKTIAVQIYTPDGRGNSNRDRVHLWGETVYDDKPFVVHCPALDVVRLYAHPYSEYNASSASSAAQGVLKIPLADIVLLGFLVGQLFRDEDQRARLELQGVGFARTKGMDSDLRSLLEDHFPRIVHITARDDPLSTLNIDDRMDDLGDL